MERDCAGRQPPSHLRFTAWVRPNAVNTRKLTGRQHMSVQHLCLGLDQISSSVGGLLF